MADSDNSTYYSDRAASLRSQIADNKAIVEANNAKIERLNSFRAKLLEYEETYPSPEYHFWEGDESYYLNNEILWIGGKEKEFADIFTQQSFPVLEKYIFDIVDIYDKTYDYIEALEKENSEHRNFILQLECWLNEALAFLSGE